MKKFICALLAASLVSATVISVSASDIVNAKAQLRPDFTIVIDERKPDLKARPVPMYILFFTTIPHTFL